MLNRDLSFSRRVAVVLGALALLACKGDPGALGPTGAQGPAGPQGPPGPTVGHDRLPCFQPDGGVPRSSMVDLGYTCIETARETTRATISFQSAAALCQADGMRLCRYSEWVTACQTAISQLDRMTDDWEWVDEVYVVDGGIMPLVVGNGSCAAAEVVESLSTRSFRCCQ